MQNSKALWRNGMERLVGKSVNSLGLNIPPVFICCVINVVCTYIIYTILIQITLCLHIVHCSLFPPFLLPVVVIPIVYLLIVISYVKARGMNELNE